MQTSVKQNTVFSDYTLLRSFAHTLQQSMKKSEPYSPENMVDR